MDMARRWTDLDLYEHFGLTPAQIEYVEKVIAPRDTIFSLDSPVPATHLPGGRKYRAGDALDEAEGDADE